MTSNNIILVSVFNNACVNIALNFLASLKKVNLTHLHTSYVTDQNTYEIITSKGYNCVLKTNTNFGTEKMDFATENFNLSSYFRYSVIHELLQKYEYVWYLDVDTVVLDDIVNYFYSLIDYNKFDLFFQNDLYSPVLCTGCMLVKSGKYTLNLMKLMASQTIYNKNDQDLLNELISKINNEKEFLCIGIFQINQFVNGEIYFKEQSQFLSEQKKFRESNEPLYFVHANCMVGLDKKIQALKDKGLWFIEE